MSDFFNLFKYLYGSLPSEPIRWLILQEFFNAKYESKINIEKMLLLRSLYLFDLQVQFISNELEVIF